MAVRPRTVEQHYSGGDLVTQAVSFVAPLEVRPSPRSGLAVTRVFLGGQPRIEFVGGWRPGNNLQYIP